MMTVGLTGGYASGKTFVAGELEALGCHLIYADRLGHEVLQPGGAAYEPAVREFGEGILEASGSIDRKRLGAIVFSSPALLSKLNGFVHPAVFAREEQMLTEFQKQDPQGIAIVEAAILIETGRFRNFDRLILTVCDEETQITRGMHRDGLSREQVLERLARQLPVAEKRKHAHYVIDSGGTKDDTVRQVARVYGDLKQVTNFQLK